MGTTFVLAYGGSVAVTVLNAVISSAHYDPEHEICEVASKTALPIVATSLPLAYETLAMGLTWWSAVDSPRLASTPFSRTLAKDGFHFFLVGLPIPVARAYVELIAQTVDHCGVRGYQRWVNDDTEAVSGVHMQPVRLPVNSSHAF
jgi:hypothetical protein